MAHLTCPEPWFRGKLSCFIDVIAELSHVTFYANRTEVWDNWRNSSLPGTTMSLPLVQDETDLQELSDLDFKEPSPAAHTVSNFLINTGSPSKRPPIDYSSFSAFRSSLRNRFISLWNRRFILCLLSGQILSLCITCTNVTTTELINRNWALPTTQTFFL